MVVKVILISGAARSGKDYCFSKIREGLEKKGKKVCQAAYADELKEYVEILFGIDREKLDEWKNSGDAVTINGVTMRQILQRLGTDIFRKVHQNYWVEVMKKKVLKAQEDGYDYFFITDCRFENEAQIDVPEKLHVKVIGKVQNSLVSHPSENNLSNWNFDYYINNVEYENTDREILKFMEFIGE
jgi:hypothetical protein